MPKPEHKKMKTLPVKQQTFFLREAKDSRVFEMYYVKLVTGLRRGKLLGLKWEDIDLERSNLRVKRQIARVNGEVAEAPLKTKNAYRTLPLAGPSPRTVSCIHAHRVLERAGLAKFRFHDLRHAFATQVLQNGVTSKQCPGCWDPSRQGSPWTPMPTS